MFLQERMESLFVCREGENRCVTETSNLDEPPKEGVV